MKSINSHLTAVYAIKAQEIELRIAILDIDLLLLQEGVIPELLDQLTAQIESDRCLNHPIIVDSESYLVLDGVHRVTALKKLKCTRIPACLVDYKNPAIEIFSWHRTISGTNATNQLIAQVQHMGGKVEKVNHIEENGIGVPPVFAAIKSLDENFLMSFKFKGLKEAYDVIACIEKRLKSLGFEINYETESDAQQKLTQRQAEAILLTPKLSKESIIDTARSKEIFARKASRHIIPARPMLTRVPLDLLKSNKPLSEVNQILKNMLQKKRFKRIPYGSIFEGRRYEEDLYVFED